MSRAPWPHRSRWLWAAGLLMLALGVAVYVLDRPDGTAMLLPRSWVMHAPGQSWFGAIGGSLPSFVHAFAFSLFTALVLPRTWRHGALACGGWALCETLFELGQHPQVSPWLVQQLHAMAGWPGMEALRRYFKQGSFSTSDVVAGLAGAALAFGALWWLCYRETGPARPMNPDSVRSGVGRP